MRRLGNTATKVYILIFSYIFYSWSYPPYIILLFLSTMVDFIVGKKIYFEQSIQRRKIYLTISLALNLGLLGFFKYTNFFLDNIANLFTIEKDYIDIILPVGISFFTFQSMSYTIDVYRKVIKYEESFLDFAVYISFFPQLVAGPIVLAKDFLIQLKDSRNIDLNSVFSGFYLIILGYFLKSVVADNLSVGADNFFMSPSNFNLIESWYYLYSYAFQIFGDFAGYSYIAIGIAKIIGYQLPTNFNYPYLATSITDFWRRWHISLSTWLKNYLYISLGGNRISPARTSLNLMITMLLGGLWHGANWNFVIWGGIHGLALVVDKKMVLLAPSYYNSSNLVVKSFQIFITFNIVCLSWIFFRTQDITHSIQVLNALFLNENGILIPHLLGRVAFFLGVSVYVFVAIDSYLKSYKIVRQFQFVFYSAAVLLMFVLSLGLGMRSSSFIYFQF